MSLTQSVLKQVVRTVVKSSLHEKVSIPKIRYRMDLMRYLPMPSAVSVNNDEMLNIPYLKITPEKKTNGIIIYLHGGAYCVGSPLTHKDLVARLAKVCNREAYLIDYRLAPEHPFPAALDDAYAVYERLSADHDDIVIAGDSAGGGLSVALMQLINQKSIKKPKALVLFSPWVDLTCSGSSMKTHAERDPMLAENFLKKCAERYAVNTSLENSGLSPLFGEFDQFPPVLIQVGSEEILLDDSLRLEQRLTESNVEVKLTEYTSLWHVFQAHASLLKPSRDALVEVNEFISAMSKT